MSKYQFVDINSEEFQEYLQEQIEKAIEDRDSTKKYKPNQLLTPEEACEILKIRSSKPNVAIRNLTNPKKYRKPLKPTTGVARTYLYKYSDVMEFIKNKR